MRIHRSSGQPILAIAVLLGAIGAAVGFAQAPKHSANGASGAKSVEAPKGLLALDTFDGSESVGFSGTWTNADFARTGVLDAPSGYVECDRGLATRLDKRTASEVWIALTSKLSAPLTQKNAYRAFSPLNTGQHFFAGFRADRGDGRRFLFGAGAPSALDFSAAETTILLRIRFQTASYEIRGWMAAGDGKTIEIEKDAPFIADVVIAKPAISKLMFNADQDPGVKWTIRRLAFATTKDRALGVPGAKDERTETKTTMTAIDRLLAPEAKLETKAPILFFGDSITQAGGYIHMLEALLAEYRSDVKVPIVNAGISGHKVPDLLARFDRDVSAKKPKTVVIYIGVNDVWHQVLNGHGTPPEEFAAGLKTLIEKTRAIGAVPVLLTLATVGERTNGKNPLDPKLDEYCAITKKVAAENGAACRDLRAAFMKILRERNAEQKESGILTNDGVHMLPAGDATILEEVAAGILEAMK